MTQTALAQESCKLPSLHITHIMHNWKSHEQRIGRHPQEHRTVFLFQLSSNQKLLQMQEYTHVLMQLRTRSPPYVWLVLLILPALKTLAQYKSNNHLTGGSTRPRPGSPPYVPYDAPVPHAGKQVLSACPIETMNMIVLLLPLGQRLSTDKWPCHMEAPLVCTIHGANLIIHTMSLHFPQ